MQKRQKGLPRDRQYDAYLIHVEHEQDFYFIVEGVCVISEDHHYTVYSLDSMHNFLRAAVLKYPLSELLGEGVTFRGAQIKLEDLSLFRRFHHLEECSLRELLTVLYQSEPQRHYFLERFLFN
ncbi:hypothetical protein [Sulfoacidibacillus thermotolerans]|uniref:Uncharacterized protein n=1 Tax=Sulfoacidibacillus thermotolerans TaxID=1765684 RepID=A0A2U3DCP0_SULT2|nr:hypothetical protein [Sulfoacidibacillus thermotolerans]PWI59047.1 hypothetical protein BM613_00065 [Sulfoacidibacillus thermotolerans]